MRRVRLHRRPSGPRPRLLGLLALAAAFLLVPAGQAAAEHGEPHLKVNLIGEEGGGGEVVSPDTQGFWPPGTPPLECNLPEGVGAEQEGVCENEMEAPGEEGIWAVGMSAIPSPNSEFVKWKGVSGIPFCFNNDPTERHCQVLSTGQEGEINAIFKCEEGKVCGVPLTLAKTGEGDGTVTSSPAGIGCAPGCEEEEVAFAEGMAVTLTAEPDGESTFDGWGVGDCDAEPAANECEVEMDEAKLVEAEFSEVVVVEHELDVTVTGKGKVDADSGAIANCRESSGVCADEYVAGTEVVLTATPDSGNQFEGWSGCDSEPGGNCKVTMSVPKSVTATFKATPPPPALTLTITKAGTGSGTVTCDGGACAASYPEGTTVTLAATAASGSTFAGWSGGGCSGTGACKVTMSADTTVTATFNANPPPKCATNPALCPPPPPGTAKAAGTALVKANKALLKLSCSGGPCKGSFKLTAKVKQGKKRKNKVIGKASFDIPAGSSKTVKVKITNGQVKKVLKQGKTVKSKLSGAGIQSRTVKLKPATKKAKPSARAGRRR